MDSRELFDLSPREFEQLIFELLPDFGYGNVSLFVVGKDVGIDIEAERNGERVVVEVKHKRNMSIEDVIRAVRQLLQNSQGAKEMILATSALLSTEAKSAGENQVTADVSLRFIDGADILALISKKGGKKSHLLVEAKFRKKSEWFRLTTSVVGIIVALLTNLFSSQSIFLLGKKQTLDSRIENVEKALASLRDLESYLGDVKKDIEATQQATQLASEKYAKALELQKMSQPQIEALKNLLAEETWQKRVKDVVVSFALGVLSSVAASIVWDMWKRRVAIR